VSADVLAPGFDLGRTGRVFADLRAQGRGALVGFLHVGYPDVPRSLAALRALTG
jgi:tryptophan synthase alpha chain